jgi:CRISPR-associated exonuclease Cas4
LPRNWGISRDRRRRGGTDSASLCDESRCDIFSEDDLLPISALQHLLFCERQCALIHVEQQWTENRFTAEGRILHERVHESAAESRGDVRIVRGLRLRSLQLGLIGIADVVEWHRDADRGMAVAGLSGQWRPFPVEYKRGKPKANACDEVQLCAQAMCLEEMLNCTIESGALFYGKTRRRKDLALTAALRNTVANAASRLHALFAANITPPAEFGKKCESCSLKDVCLPELRKSAQAYLQSAIRDLQSETRH